MAARARRARRRRGACSLGCAVRVGMVLGIAGLVALQLALFANYARHEDGLAARAGAADAEDADADATDADADPLAGLDGAYEADDAEKALDDDDGGGGGFATGSDDEDDTGDDDNAVEDGDGIEDFTTPMNVFPDDWLRWMKRIEPDEGVQDAATFSVSDDEDLDEWLAQHVDETVGTEESAGEPTVEADTVKDIRKRVSTTLGLFDTNPHKVAVALEMAVLEGVMADASSNLIFDRHDDAAGAKGHGSGGPGSSSASSAARSRAAAKESADDLACSRWRSAIGDAGSPQITQRTYSIADNVPPAHAALWRRAFAGQQQQEGTKASWTEDANVAGGGAELHRVLVLPWTAQAALLEVGEQISQRNDPYYLTLTRGAPGPGPSGWALTARRQDLLSKLRDYMRPFTCSLDDLGVVPPAYEVVASQADCQRLFSQQSEADRQAKEIWLVKGYGTTVCPAQSTGPCVEAQAMTQVIAGVGPLRRQYGHCQPSAATPVLVERAVPSPLLVHSRRLKWHTLVLVASSDPWRTYFSPGFVTLASPDARADRSGPFGTSIASAEALARETTDLHKQTPFQQRGEQEPPLWGMARFLRYLESYGICERPCAALTSRARNIAHLLVDASRRGAPRPLPRISPRFSDLQVIRVDFWITEKLQPVLHRGSADLGFLLDDWGASTEAIKTEVANLLAEGVALTVDRASPPALWEPLQDEYADFCRGAEPRVFNPCSAIEPMPLVIKPAAPKTNPGQQKTSAGGAQAPTRESAKGNEPASGLLGDGAPPVQILEWGATKFSPKSPLPAAERHSALVSLDVL